MKFKVLDLFSGAGGFSYGLKLNGNFEILLANDLDNVVLKTFKNNHQNAKIIHGDITINKIKKNIISEAKKLEINMIIGGPPCQGFSLKGKKIGLNDSRNFLFLEYVDIVKKIMPKVFILENVKSMIFAENGFFIQKALELFSKLNYKVSYKILKASNFGVPQNRERVFILGCLSKKLEFPKQNTKKTLTTEDAISDLNYLKSGEKSSGKYKIKPLSDFQKKMRKKSKNLQWHNATSHSKHAVMKMQLIPIKGNKTFLPLELRTKQKFQTTWSRLHWDKPSPTIDTRFDTPSNGQNIHPILNRAITPREAARIQSFPDIFYFYGNKTSICKQIGNAVPPLLAKAIGDSIFCELNSSICLKINEAEIYNEDAYKFNINNLPKLDAIITDPPYNISKKNNFNKMKQKRNGLDFGEWDKNFDLYSWIENYYDKLKSGGSYIIFGSYLYISHIIDKLTSIGAQVKDVIKWIKSNPMPRNVNRRYVSDTEFAIWAVKPTKKWTFNKPDNKPYIRAEFKTRVVLGKERTIHPTQKSLELMEDIIKIHTNKNDVIFDPFMGSGTTGVAALKLNRKFIGIEKNKKFYKISIDRLQNKK